MAVKVLVNTLGQHIVSEVKSVENKETKELVAYWLENPRLVNYSARPEEDGGGLSVNFGTLCPLSDEQSFSVRTDYVVAILEPRDDVESSYQELVAPAQEEANVIIDGDEGDAVVAGDVEDGANPGLTD